MNSKNETKSKILQVASELFAKHGFEGTSVRDISKAAEVNLASINYHFNNKQNLYCEVMNHNIESLEQDIEELAKKSDSLVDFSWELFGLLTEEANALTNSFKLFITNDFPVDQGSMPKFCSKDNFQPPGHATMMSIIANEVGEDIPVRAREWAVRSIFTYVVHSALVMGSSMVKSMENDIPYLHPDEKKRAITCLAESVLNFLKEHPERFS